MKSTGPVGGPAERAGERQFLIQNSNMGGADPPPVARTVLKVDTEEALRGKAERDRSQQYIIADDPGGRQDQSVAASERSATGYTYAVVNGADENLKPYRPRDEEWLKALLDAGAAHKMRPKNDALRFIAPRTVADIGERMFEYYVRNTHVRCIDTDEDPKPCPASMNLPGEKQIEENPAIQK